MATRVEDLVQVTPANAQVKIPTKKERLPSAWRIKLVEDLLLAYPDLDRNMINIAIDFDEIQAAKFGADYDPEEHIKEIFPALSSDSEDESKPDPATHIAKKIKLARNGEGEDGETGDKQQAEDERVSRQLADDGGHGELQQ